MSRQSDQKAQAAFDSLDEMNMTERMDALRDESYEGYSVPCSARLAGRVMNRLGISSDEHDILWTKLAGRSVAHVYRLLMKCEESKPEERVGLFTDFARKRPMLDGAEGDFPEGVFEEAG